MTTACGLDRNVGKAIRAILGCESACRDILQPAHLIDAADQEEDGIGDDECPAAIQTVAKLLLRSRSE